MVDAQVPKNIVFCSDGTWCGPAQPENEFDVEAAIEEALLGGHDVTNVVKLFDNLAGEVRSEPGVEQRKEREKVLVGVDGRVEQISKYIHGVGDSSNPVIKVLGGVFGSGVIARIVRGYTFISRNYDVGDSIQLLGFSRGAYTARALAGMISNVGLLDRSHYDVANKSEAYLRGYAAWIRSKNVVFSGRGGSLLTAAYRFVADLFTYPKLRDKDLLPNVPISSVAVWDTVGSLGLPQYVQGKRRDWFRFTDCKLSPKVVRGYHAMALDERRVDFPVTRWEPDSRAEEVWFIGSHSDVGGGNAVGQAALSDLALNWMMTKLEGRGVQFSVPPVHVPRLDGQQSPFATPWESPPFNLFAPSRRTPKPGDHFHESLERRWRASPDYRSDWPNLFEPA
ncbi:MAG TPA: DUF2235 domain-containing protein [Polyangiaceae bacterium]|jgi:uncharacterized protein (DUF2235 family)|nr:DUF2235 domain-containing protein [Polyangiaceae bacterium]